MNKEIEDDISKYAKLESLANNEGGKLLIDSSEKDIINSIDTIIGKYKEASHIELIAIIARLEARLSLLRTLTNAGKNKKLAKQELERLLNN